MCVIANPVTYIYGYHEFSVYTQQKTYVIKMKYETIKSCGIHDY